ncbi:60S ribosomal protein L15 [Conoideocrella luteorostrata]|uniref:60S ribosomal protein L15 n=1 Tax=Conoideocrella luteorostrata TaxID=1105319 RepID=A0AAJ0CGG8_9HYPO|nr:60S ribosomal protein L15 [Conoideocrella luteorostrata]
MAPSTRKRKQPRHDDIEDAGMIESDAEDTSTQTPPKGKQHKSKKQPAAKTLDTGDVLNVLKSQSSANASTAIKKGRTSTQEAKKSVEKLANDLRKFIEAEMRPESSEKSLPNIKSFAGNGFSEEAQRMLPSVGAAPFKEAHEITNDIYDHAKDILNDCQVLAKEYEKKAGLSGKIKTPSLIRWGQDIADLHELNKCILAFSIKVVEQNIIPHAAGSTPEIGHDDVDQIAWELLENSRPQKDAETWGNVAEIVLQSMARITAIL